MPQHRFRTRVVLIACASFLLAVGAVEAGLRTLLPPSSLRDTHTDCFWSLLLAERMPVYRENGLGPVRLDRTLGWRMLPMVGATGEPVPIPRLHARARPTDGDPPAHRLVVLGDSFTRGLGVSAPETYAARMAAAREDLEVFNLSANGYGTDQELLLWQRVGADCAADVVLLAYYVPNFHRNALRVREFPKPWFELADGELVLRGTPTPGLEEAVRLHADDCGTRPRCLDLLATVLRHLHPEEDEATFRHKAALTAAIVRELDASVEAAGARLFVAILPHRRFENYPDHERIVGGLLEVGRECGIPMLDLTPLLRRERAAHPKAPLYGENEHWTPAAHALAAKALLSFLEEHDAL